MFVNLVLMAVCARVMATPAEDAVKKDLAALQGTWTVVYSELNGEKRQDVGEVKKMRLTINGDNWKLEYHNNVGDKHVARLKLDPTKQPKAVDFKFSDGLLTGESWPSIYDVNGDDLKFCFPSESRERPKDFDSRAAAGGQWLLVLKSEK
jgi:uncharacterized protein (TIGR03067 family)